MARATDSLELGEVLSTLESWRRTDWLTASKGPEGYRRMLRAAEDTLRTGDRVQGSVSWRGLRAELGPDR